MKSQFLQWTLAVFFALASFVPLRAQSCAAGSTVPLMGLSFVSTQAQAYLIGFSEFTNPSSPKKKYRTKTGAGTTEFSLYWSQDRTCVDVRWTEAHPYSGIATYDKFTGVLTDNLVGGMDDNACVTVVATQTTRENSPSGGCSTCWWTPYDQKATTANKMEFLLDEDTEEDAENRALPTATTGASNVAYRTRRQNDFFFSFSRVKYTAVFNVTCPADYDVTVFYTTRPRTFPSTTTRRALVIRKRLETGIQTVEGSMVAKEYDVDYTVEGIEARSPCDSAAAASGSFERGSVKVALSLGRGSAGISAGSLLLDAAAISAALYTPSSLVAAVADSIAVEVVRDTSGVLRQVKAPQTFADVVVLDVSSYEVRFYSPSGVGAQDPTTKIYAVSGTPIASYRFENPDAAQSLANRLRITETRGTTSKIIEYLQDVPTGLWSLSLGGGLRRESEVTTLVNGDKVKTLTVRDDVNAVVSKNARTYHTYSWGEELIKEVLDPDGAALTTTYEFYSNVAASDPNYKRLRQRTDPSGAWERYTYAAGGRGLKTIQPFLNADPLTTDEALCRVTENVYDSLADADGDALAEARTTTILRTLGQETGRRYRIEWSKPVTLGGDLCRRRSDIVCVSAGAAWDAAANLVTESLPVSSGAFAGRERRLLNPDGTASLTTYSLAANGVLTTTNKNGVPNPTRDDIVDGRRTVTFTSDQGQVTGESMADIASNLLLTSWTVTEFDATGRPTRLDNLDGTYVARTYSCCGLASERDRFGFITSYTYDALGRQVTATRQGITIKTSYDADGRVKSVVRVGTNGTEIIQETSVYDLAGRLIQKRDALNRLITYSEVYNAGSGQTTRTTTNPDGGTIVDVAARDGARLSVGGPAAAPHTFDYGIDVTGVFTKDTAIGADAGGQPITTAWVKTYTDLVGRGFRTAFADGAIAQSFYNGIGQLVRQVDPDGVTVLFGYNARGERESVAIDVNGNGAIDLAGTDRITRTSSSIVTKTEASVNYTVLRSTTQKWETDSQDSPVVVAMTEQSSDGLRIWQTIRGLTTRNVTVLDGAGGRTVTTTAPDGVKTVQVFAGDHLVSAVTTTAADQPLTAVSYSYDPHGRVSAVTDARNGATTFTYYADDQINTVTTPDPDTTRSGAGYDPQVITYTYDSAGRVQAVTQPDGTVVNTTYWPTGAVRRTSGARIYPVEYTYDPQGRVKTLTTWQNYAGDSGRALTTWNYDASRGWLLNKRHADNTGPSYTYSPSGRLLTRTWARTPVVTTVYSYNVAGDIAGIDYSDATPDVGLAYDRTGRPKTIVDGVGARSLTYHSSGHLEDETYTSGLLSGFAVDRSFDALQRLSALSALNSPLSTLVTATYGYDAASRLETVTAGSNTTTYSYVANSPLIESVVFRNGTTIRLTTGKAYDKLDRLSSIAHTLSSQPSALIYSYTYDAANQRTRITREDNASWIYAYDTLGQVVSGKKSLADGTAVLGHDYAWTYDDIGNRKTSTINGAFSTYFTSAMNQYTQRTVPGAIDVLGAAGTTATVTVAVNNSAPQSVTRQGELFYKQATVANAAAAQSVQLKITGVKNLAGPNGEDAVTEIIKTVFVAQTPETFVHDADGNRTDDARWRYTWDAENRLIAIETSATAAAFGVARQKLEFSYDGQSRRVGKKVYHWTGGAWVLAAHTLFVYGGWNLLAEVNALGGNAAVRTYGWGLDVSGSMQGAGGIGGLLAVTDAASGAIYFVAADGNGNVTGAVRVSDGVLAAKYDYNAFGETMLTEGTFAAGNPFRFSTKYTDAETGLLYFGYRFYDSGAGRWLNRDPYGEEGGVNLYGFVGNAPTEWADPLGLALYAFDGTNNDGYRDEAKGRETNVFVLYQSYAGVNRVYSPGVGTNDGIINPLGSAFGLGGQSRINDMLEKAGEFLQKGDTVADIIGFSRGAAQARGFANKLKEKYPCIKIRWMGLFDTVATEGLPNDVNIGYKLGIPKDTGNVLHLSAGGERRAKLFALSSLNPALGVPNPNPNYRELIESEAVHSDVGGGYGSNRGIANSALYTMWSDGRSHDVPFGELPASYSNYMGTPNDSRWFNDKLVEFLTGRRRVRKVYYHP